MSKNSIFEVKVDLANGEAEFSTSDWFEKLDPLLRADILRDILHCVEIEYERAVKDLHDSFDGRKAVQ